MDSRVEWFEPRIVPLEHSALGRSCRSRIFHPRTDRESRFGVNLLGDRIAVKALNHPGRKATVHMAWAILTVSGQALVRSLRRPCSRQCLCPYAAHTTQPTPAQADGSDPRGEKTQKHGPFLRQTIQRHAYAAARVHQFSHFVEHRFPESLCPGLSEVLGMFARKHWFNADLLSFYSRP